MLGREGAVTQETSLALGAFGALEDDAGQGRAPSRNCRLRELPLVREGLSHPTAGAQGQQFLWICLDVFLVYRIIKGSVTAWFVALALTALLMALVLIAGFLSPLVTILLTTSIVQLALLLHPAIRRRVGIARSTAGAPI